ncbi:MAG: hypothetical protein AABX55_02950 [Nanoarchaeota archaeon]
MDKEPINLEELFKLHQISFIGSCKWKEGSTNNNRSYKRAFT